MTSIDIYSILSSKPHNVHYLKRYVCYLGLCKSKNKNLQDKHIHHIIPASMFPEYKNLRVNTWNSIILTPRQHYIAHAILAKTFAKEMHNAFVLMRNR